jgi:hypothetical protein
MIAPKRRQPKRGARRNGLFHALSTAPKAAAPAISISFLM